MIGLVYFYHFHFIVAPASSMARYRDPVFRPFAFATTLASTVLSESVSLKSLEVLRPNLVQI